MIYLAASFKDKNRAKVIANVIREAGIEVVARWLLLEKESNIVEEKQQYALVDFEDVEKCQALVLLTGLSVTGGKHVEMGMALGMGKPVFIYDSTKENIFHYLTDWPKVKRFYALRSRAPVQHFSDLRVMIQEIKTCLLPLTESKAVESPRKLNS